LCGPAYPNGIDIVNECQLETLVKERGVTMIELAYSDVAHVDVMHIASRAQALGCDFILLGPNHTMLPSRKPVIAIGATRTGVGKSQTARYIWALIRAAGLRTAVVRHPMPYGTLMEQRCQRFTTLEDMKRHKCTIEEMEEYEPHIERGAIVYAGVDYAQILANAEKECDLVLWDGGNNDFPFFKPDLMITLVDPLRPTHGESYYPGETNVRIADIIMINKVDVATPTQIAACENICRRYNPHARILKAKSPATFVSPVVAHSLRAKKVLIIEDGPTTTHGGMAIGAGYTAAVTAGAIPVDPRPYAVGLLAEVLAKFPHLTEILPAMGYSDEQLKDLETTINKTPCDAVIIGTPIGLERQIKIQKPFHRVYYNVDFPAEDKTFFDNAVASVIAKAKSGASAKL